MPVRHIVRVLIQLAIPVIAVLVFIPAPLRVRVLTVIAAAWPATSCRVPPVP